MMLEYTLTQEELIKFHKDNVIETLLYKSWLFLNLINILICIYAFIKLGDYKENLIIIISIILIVVLFRKKSFLYVINRKLNKVYNQYNKKYLFSPLSIHINSEGIYINTAFNDKSLKWKDVKDLHIIDNNIIIRFSNYEDIFIPSRAIKLDEELTDLINLFEKNAFIYPEYSYPKDIKLY